MKNLKGIAFLAAVVVLAIVAISLVVRLVSSAVSGFFQLILGLVVVVALVLIVFWMFSYAKRNRK